MFYLLYLHALCIGFAYAATAGDPVVTPPASFDGSKNKLVKRVCSGNVQKFSCNDASAVHHDLAQNFTKLSNKIVESDISFAKKIALLGDVRMCFSEPNARVHSDLEQEYWIQECSDCMNAYALMVLECIFELSVFVRKKLCVDVFFGLSFDPEKKREVLKVASGAFALFLPCDKSYVMGKNRGPDSGRMLSILCDFVHTFLRQAPGQSRLVQKMLDAIFQSRDPFIKKIALMKRVCVQYGGDGQKTYAETPEALLKKCSNDFDDKAMQYFSNILSLCAFVNQHFSFNLFCGISVSDDCMPSLISLGFDTIVAGAPRQIPEPKVNQSFDGIWQCVSAYQKNVTTSERVCEEVYVYWRSFFAKRQKTAFSNNVHSVLTKAYRFVQCPVLKTMVLNNLAGVLDFMEQGKATEPGPVSSSQEDNLVNHHFWRVSEENHVCILRAIFKLCDFASQHLAIKLYSGVACGDKIEKASREIRLGAPAILLPTYQDTYALDNENNFAANNALLCEMMRVGFVLKSMFVFQKLPAVNSGAPKKALVLRWLGNVDKVCRIEEGEQKRVLNALIYLGNVSPGIQPIIGPVGGQCLPHTLSEYEARVIQSYCGASSYDKNFISQMLSKLYGTIFPLLKDAAEKGCVHDYVHLTEEFSEAWVGVKQCSMTILDLVASDKPLGKVSEVFDNRKDILSCVVQGVLTDDPIISTFVFGESIWIWAGPPGVVMQSCEEEYIKSEMRELMKIIDYLRGK